MKSDDSSDVWVGKVNPIYKIEDGLHQVINSDDLQDPWLLI